MEPVKHLVARLHEALATDPRTNILDVNVRIAVDRAYLIGQVDSEERRRVAEQVIRELLPGQIELINELWIPSYNDPKGPEILR
jgi:osmotically-inducible protein OsmY